MKGVLYRPHDKEYCVHYQTKLGTLKGISNDWAEVLPGSSCSWENQQHGRGHHVKVVLKDMQAGSNLRLTLIHEDGTNAPAFTVTKTGGEKSTMLIGIDPRDWRDGLSWTSKSHEGPRKWIPAANFMIKVADSNTRSQCVKSLDVNSPATQGSKDCKYNYMYIVPCNQQVIIPIRIEVLSAVKGAGNFSRYCVLASTEDAENPAASDPHLATPTSTPDRDASPQSWKSPSILIEAKWLPAAPVREQNKKRFSKSAPTITNGSVKGEDIPANAKMTLQAAARILKAATAEIMRTRNNVVPGGGAAPPTHFEFEHRDLKNLENAIYQYRLQTAVAMHDIVEDSPAGNLSRQHSGASDKKLHAQHMSSLSMFPGTHQFLSQQQTQHHTPPSAPDGKAAPDMQQFHARAPPMHHSVASGPPAFTSKSERGVASINPSSVTTSNRLIRPKSAAAATQSHTFSSPPRSPALSAITRSSFPAGMFDKFDMLASAATDFSRLATSDHHQDMHAHHQIGQIGGVQGHPVGASVVHKKAHQHHRISAAHGSPQDQAAEQPPHPSQPAASMSCLKRTRTNSWSTNKLGENRPPFVRSSSVVQFPAQAGIAAPHPMGIVRSNSHS